MRSERSGLNRLRGKVVLVTGSGRGFGRCLAIAFAKEGAKLVSVARTVSELKYTEKVIRLKNGVVFTFPVDLSKEKDILDLKDMVLKKYGKLDVLVNNAATSPWKTFEDMTLEEWDTTLAVNLRAPFLLTKAFFETMKNQGGGSIINISSKSAETGYVAELAYCPSKYGLEGLTQCLALELKPFNIAVNSLNVSAPLGKKLKPTGLSQANVKNIPKEIREAYADEESMIEAFSEAWVFLALQKASGITGQRFETDVLADYLKQHGWEAAIKKWSGKLTKAVYKKYDFPKSVRYQTPDGGWKEYNLNGEKTSD